jgi:PAS domain S-box-containing protein
VSVEPITNPGTLPGKLSALVLEDNADDAELLIRTLRTAGWIVDWKRVETAEAFAGALDARAWDIILADYSVPGFGAFQALEHVRSRDRVIPFIVISGAIGEEVAATLLRAGADDFVMKGHLHRLARSVERALREASQRRRRRQAERERRILAERWKLLLDHSEDAVALHEAIRNEEGRIVDFRYLEWNPAAERIFGLPRDQVLGRTGSQVFPGIVESGLMARCVRVIETGIAERIEEYQVRMAPQPRILDISCFRLDPDHFVALIRDATERVLNEQRLRDYAAEVALGNQALERVNAELERRNAELEEFAHVASHDLQEPLRKVISFGDLLARALGGRLDPKCARYLSLMQEATRRLHTLIRDLLIMSRAERASLRKERTPLEQCVRAALELLSVRLQETGAAVQIDPLPTLFVDSALISQLYQNLLSNALKFCPPERKPFVHITCENASGGFILGVADNGIGVEPQYHQKIFEAFQRLHSREKYEGSGIGLAVCRKIVTRHGGTIWVDSTPGKGSHFRFRLGEAETPETQSGGYGPDAASGALA